MAEHLQTSSTYASSRALVLSLMLVACADDGTDDTATSSSDVGSSETTAQADSEGPLDRCALYEATTLTTQPLIGAAETEALPGVVAIVYNPNDPDIADGCTGTLIDPQTVLTAGHCILSEMPVRIYIGADWKRHILTEDDPFFVTWNEVVHMEAHPDYFGLTLRNDVGVLLLDAPAPVEPISVRDVSAPETIGASLRLVGYGSDGPVVEGNTILKEGIGRKREGRAIVTEVSDQEVLVNSSDAQSEVCYGDSGGPAFIEDPDGTLRQVGIISRTMDVRCDSGFALARLDIHADFVRERVAVAGNAALTPQLTCVEPRPDGGWTAHFGYQNDNLVPVHRSDGPANNLCGLGQPEVFEPGEHSDAFAVDFEAHETLVWNLTSPDGTLHTIQANTDASLCP
ncbi:MAG: S1 family peptidase [Myxococcota bacterium]